MTVVISLGVLVITVFVVAMILSFISWLSIDLYFMQLEIENHPVLHDLLETTLQAICKEENIRVFHKSYDEMNKKHNTDAVGRYEYTINKEFQEKMDNALADIEALERKYHQSYEKMCADAGVATEGKECFVLPQIQLCDESLLVYGLKTYYTTFFHELGHHFVEKEHLEQSEEAADKKALELVLKRLPFFFQLMPYFRFKYSLNTPELTLKERKTALLQYAKYYIKNRKTIIKPKKNGKKVHN